ncbi:hypothetical protein KKF91_16290 [Myxococcota bacterium]|nr:hypothetical protein [Myxococcota bacterium]MBU1432095.1 hypothetical protein [Myxococcota bacterium]MBU1896776.1 hypothetical protein [Myxococcota bacterium]
MRVDSIRSLLSLTLLSLTLLACGGPSPERRLEGLTLQRRAPGGYLGGCFTSGRLRLARVGGVEAWDLSGEAPRQLKSEATLTPLTLTGAGCVEGIGVLPLGDARQIWIAPYGWGIVEGRRRLGWRVAMGGVRDAALHEGAVWLVGEGGAWRWRLTAGASATPLPLPAALSGRGLAGIFRGDGRLWLRDIAGFGWPTRFDGMSLRLAGEPGQLARAPEDIELFIGEGRARGRLGAPLIFTRGEAAPVTLSPRLGAYLPLGEGRLLLTTDEGVELWRLDGAPRRLRAWPLGGPTARIFHLEGRLIFIGRDYGIIEGRLDGASNDRASTAPPS